MNQPQYDMQAHGEQIRHQQIAASEAHEARLDDALNLAHISTAEMEGSERANVTINP